MLSSTTVQKYEYLFFRKLIVVFSRQGCMKLIESDSSNIYNVIEDFYFK